MSSKEKLSEAYNCIDEYPIGTMFYRYILTFYIGVCKIDKTVPHQFTKKINHIANYSRFLLTSLTVQNTYNILNRETLPRTTYVEDVILIKNMAEFNHFCISHQLKEDLIFNPFKQMESFHAIIIGLMHNPFFPQEDIKSLTDILEYIETSHYKELCNIPVLNKGPTVDLTQDNLKDFYYYKTFYLSIIQELKLESRLKYTMEILRLPFK